jgi:hypothetical protein
VLIPDTKKKLSNISLRKRRLGIPTRRRHGNIKMYLMEVDFEDDRKMELARNSVQIMLNLRVPLPEFSYSLISFGTTDLYLPSGSDVTAT